MNNYVLIIIAVLLVGLIALSKPEDEKPPGAGNGPGGSTSDKPRPSTPEIIPINKNMQPVFIPGGVPTISDSGNGYKDYHKRIISTEIKQA